MPFSSTCTHGYIIETQIHTWEIQPQPAEFNFCMCWVLRSISCFCFIVGTNNYWVECDLRMVHMFCKCSEISSVTEWGLRCQTKIVDGFFAVSGNSRKVQLHLGLLNLLKLTLLSCSGV